jgi:hypothetical protein
MAIFGNKKAQIPYWAWVQANLLKENKIKEKWNMPIKNWALTISQLDIYFPERLKIELSSDLGADTVR